MNQAQTATANDHTHMSGFAKKKALEAAGFEVGKVTNEASKTSLWVVIDPRECGSNTIIAEDRLQGLAVNKAIEALGGL